MGTSLTAPATESKERHLTVSSKWFARKRKNIEAPEIRLAGVYLQKLGFTIGSKVTVIENRGEIIVRLDGASAERDPEETADDRRLARKVKQIAAYQESTQRPLSEDVITQYLSGEMPHSMGELLYMLINGQLSEPYQTGAYNLLHEKSKPEMKKMMCDSLFWEINQLPPKARRKRPAKQAIPSSDTVEPIPMKTTPQTRQVTTVRGNFAKPLDNLEAAEPPHEEMLDAGRNHIRKVLRSLRPLPPPDPPAGPTLRERLERVGPTRPQTHNGPATIDK